jgi:copper resistance protein B
MTRLLALGALALAAAWMPGGAPEARAHHGGPHPHAHAQAPTYFFARANRLDFGPSRGGARMSWDLDGRWGTDDHRLVARTEGTILRGRGKESEAQLLYSRPIDEFWDIEFGLRQTFSPAARSHAALALRGTLPGFIEAEAALFVGQTGQASARIKAEADIAWTPTLISRPMIELSAYASDDSRMETRAGIGRLRAAAQTRYQLTRTLAPYVELGWEKDVGRTGALARARDERGENTYAVAGVRLLY